jgi:hypothetical protein
MLCELLLLLYFKINTLKISEKQPEGLARNSLKFSELLLQKIPKAYFQKIRKTQTSNPK